MESQFSNLELVDGYFSGTIHIKAKNGDMFDVEFGYDIDTRKLDLWNCKALLVGSDTSEYEPYSVAELHDRFGGWLYEDVYGTLVWRYGPQQSFAEYEAAAYKEDYGY